MQARHWIEYARLLRESATADIDGAIDQLDFESRLMATSDAKVREGLQKRRIGQKRMDLVKALEQQRAIRADLLLDSQPDEDSDGKS